MKYVVDSRVSVGSDPDVTDNSKHLTVRLAPLEKRTAVALGAEVVGLLILAML